MNLNGSEWELDDTIYNNEMWLNEDTIESRIEEQKLSNDDFLIYHLSEIEFRQYVLSRLNELYLLLDTLKK